MIYYTHWGLLMFAYLIFRGGDTRFYDAIAFALLTISLLSIAFIWIHENDVDFPGIDYKFPNLALKLADIPSHHLPTAYALLKRRRRPAKACYCYLYGIVPLLLYRAFTVILGIDPYEMYRLSFGEIMVCVFTAAATLGLHFHGEAVFSKLRTLPLLDFALTPVINAFVCSLSICSC
mmetsp:Transcript_507/g.973  ORF Transcript_507/g.973 Transcript_507/m.973 type:complete len:177 (-) Transcript_507:151-681(-)